MNDVTIYIEDNTLRLVHCQPKKLVKRIKEVLSMILTQPIKKAFPFLGFAFFSGSLAFMPIFVRAQPNSPYCFVVQDTLSVFSRPSPTAVTADTFNKGDIAYATSSEPNELSVGRRSFVEVAIYGGNRGWLPKTSTIDGVSLIVDLNKVPFDELPPIINLEPDRCANPPESAVSSGLTNGGIVGQDSSLEPNNTASYCFAVRKSLRLYSRPSLSASTNASYQAGDIAYATTNPPTTVLSDRTAFVKVAIYNGNTAWAPRQIEETDVPALVDLSNDQCSQPGRGAAGYSSSL